MAAQRNAMILEPTTFQEVLIEKSLKVLEISCNYSALARLAAVRTELFYRSQFAFAWAVVCIIIHSIFCSCFAAMK